MSLIQKLIFYKIILGILIIISLNSCKKKDENPPTQNRIYFKGLTKTDEQGAIISIDTTDWKFNDTWIPEEAGLFSANHQMNCISSYNNKISAYPNPCNGIFALAINKQISTRVEIRLVDENFKRLISNDSITQNNIQFNAGTFGIKDTVRLYYKFIQNNCEFRGHGDIVIQ